MYSIIYICFLVNQWLYSSLFSFICTLKGRQIFFWSSWNGCLDNLFGDFCFLLYLHLGLQVFLSAVFLMFWYYIFTSLSSKYSSVISSLPSGLFKSIAWVSNLPLWSEHILFYFRTSEIVEAYILLLQLSFFLTMDI